MELNENTKLNIVIVDDNQPDHFFIKQSLTDYKNITFTSFYEGESFLRYLKEALENTGEKVMPDIVILDINMPKLTGFEIFEQVKENKLQKGIKFFILTSSLTPSDLEKSKKFKLDCYQKPFTIEKFRILLETIIEDAVVAKNED